MNRSLYGIENLSSQIVSKVQPWTLTLPLPTFASTHDYKTWLANPDTKHLLASGFEGIVPTQRYTSGNPARRMHALIADYDAQFTHAEIGQFKDRSLGSAHPVNYISKTYSGGMRAIWFLEVPVLVHSEPSLRKFLKRVAQEMRFKRLGRGWDEESFYDGNKYYAYGIPGTWEQVSDQLLPAALIELMQYETSSSGDFAGYGAEIPLETIADEVAKKFPGRWQGSFTEGARGTRFWDASADNPRGAVIRKNGMQCFTGSQPFVPWSDILGYDWVRKFEADRIGGAVGSIYFDGQVYWVRGADNKFQSYKQDNVVRMLKVGHRLSAKGTKNDPITEVEKALHHVEEKNRVEAAVSHVFDKRTDVWAHGKRYLNVAAVKPGAMSDQPQQWGVNFPFIADILTNIFGSACLDYYLGWQNRFYKSAVDGRLLAGHAMIIVGPTNVGKTLLSNYIIGGLMGGHEPATKHLLGKSQFNDHMYETPVWSVDDSHGLIDIQSQLAFSTALKEAVANPFFTCNGKFKKMGRTEWRGRVVVTLNPDQKSLMLIPSLDISIKDKLLIFRAACAGNRDFPPNIVALVESELPYFARFIYDYVPPPHIVGQSRFGIANYIDPWVESAANAGDDAAIMELLSIFRDRHFAPGAKDWEGTSSEWMIASQGIAGMQSLLRDWTPQKFGRSLGRLESKNAYSWLTKRQHRNVWLWCIGNPNTQPNPVSPTVTGDPVSVSFDQTSEVTV